MRITVADVLGWLASGMSHQEIIEDFPELTADAIRACLAYAADSSAPIRLPFPMPVLPAAMGKRINQAAIALERASTGKV